MKFARLLKPLEITMTEKRTRAQPVPRYDRIARTVHWLTAILIVAVFSLGILVDAFPPSWEDSVVNTHKLIGLSILCLVAFRLVWRRSHKPPPPEPIGLMLQRVSSISHVLLYCLMIVVPLVGLVFAARSGQGIDFGLLTLGPVSVEDEGVARQIGEIHELLAYILVGVAGTHALAALWHHFVRKDAVLMRMLPPE
jgi:cytochrome b561